VPLFYLFVHLFDMYCTLFCKEAHKLYNRMYGVFFMHFNPQSITYEGLMFTAHMFGGGVGIVENRTRGSHRLMSYTCNRPLAASANTSREASTASTPVFLVNEICGWCPLLLCLL